MTNRFTIECATFSDPDALYTPIEAKALIYLARAYGFSLEKGSEIDGLTIRQLDALTSDSRAHSMELADA